MEEKEKQLDDILSSFRCITHNFQQLLWKDAEELNITSTQLMVLRKLSLHPDIGITELADLLHLGNSAASGVVDRMVKAGLITRERSQSDKRIFKLAMTEKGKEIRLLSRQSPEDICSPWQIFLRRMYRSCCGCMVKLSEF